MTKSKNTKKALLMSVLSMILCMAMLVGSTFAWFTDSVTSGKNRIVAGNLDIELLGKIDGKYQALSDGSLFNADEKWEPGKICYRELKVQNLGTLAAKFSVNISDDMVFNFVLEPNEDGTYTGTYRALMYVIRVAVYGGNFEELVDAVNEEAGTSYTVEDREVVKKALELGLISGDLLATTDPNNGALLEGKLYPAGSGSESEKEFTLIAYWAFEKEDRDFWEIVDDDYNLKNGRKASKDLSEDDVYDYDAAKGKIIADKKNISDDGLFIDFDIVVYATQIPYESDSFGTKYDEDIEYSVLPTKAATADEFVAAIGKGKDVALTEDIALTDIVKVTDDVTIYANGKTITSAAPRFLWADEDDVTVTIVNANLVSTNTGNSSRGVQINANRLNVDLIVEDSKITMNNVADNYGVNICGGVTGGSLTLINCEITAYQCVNIYGSDMTVNIEGCTFTYVNTHNKGWSGGFITLFCGDGCENVALTVKNTKFITGTVADGYAEPTPPCLSQRM